jgi:hypothetical protein
VAYTEPDLERDPVRSVLRDAPANAALGSHPLVTARRRDDEDPEPDPEGPPPPPPPPPVSAPDLAMQFRPCLKDIPVPPGFDLERAVLDAIRTDAGSQADVRYVCADGSGRIGIWLRPAGSEEASAARARGAARIEMLRPENQFGVFINAAFVKRVAREAYDMSPKRLDHEGNPKADGPVHLTGFDVRFQFPDRIITTISGYDESPLPDVNFRLIVTDKFSVVGRTIDVQSDTDLDTDRTWIHVLAGLSALVASLVHPIFLLAAAAFITESIIIGSLDPDDKAGAGAVVAQRIPSDMLIAGGLKAVPSYDRVTVTTAGVVALGNLLVVPRDPAVSVLGPRQIAVSPGQTTVTKTYQANMRDLRSPIRFQWTGGGTAATPTRKVTAVRFDVSGLEPGKSVNREVRVTVTDADNLSATAAVFARIFMTQEEEDPDLPPICQVRPWLPQCKPDDV